MNRPADYLPFRTWLLTAIAIGGMVWLSLRCSGPPRGVTYVHPSTPRTGLLFWQPGIEYTARGVECVAGPRGERHSQFDSAGPWRAAVSFRPIGNLQAEIHLLEVSVDSSRQGSLVAHAPEALPATIRLSGGRHRQWTVWEGDRHFDTDLRTAREAGETLTITVRFKVLQAGNATEHTMVFPWVPRQWK